MYCLARSTAVSRASASRRLSRLAESWRASPSICLISRSLASSAVRPATRSSSCLLLRDELLVLAAAAAAVLCSRVAQRSARGRPAPSRAGRRRPAVRRRRPRGGQRLLERGGLLPLLARLALGLHQDLVRLLLRVEQRLLLGGLRVALGVLGDRRCACSSARPTVSAAMRLRLATQTANAAAATTAVTTAATMIDSRHLTTRVTSFPVGVSPRGWAGAARGSPDVTRRTGGGSERTAPLCRVGRSMNLLKQVEPLITSRASGFLVAEACTPRGVATHLGKHWLNEPIRHHAQSRELELLTRS